MVVEARKLRNSNWKTDWYSYPSTIYFLAEGAMVRLGIGICVIVFSVIISGCDALANLYPSQRISDLESNLSTLQHDFETLRVEYDALKVVVEALERQQQYDKFIKAFEEIAFLTPGSGGYSVTKFDLGALTTELSDVKPYANGSKVVLKIGNVLSADIDGLKITIEWREVDEEGAPQNDTAKSKDVTLTETIRAGAWTSVSLVLEGVPPEKLGFIRLKNVHHSGVKLSK